MKLKKTAMSLTLCTLILAAGINAVPARSPAGFAERETAVPQSSKTAAIGNAVMADKTEIITSGNVNVTPEEQKAFFPLTPVQRDRIERILMTSCGGVGSIEMAKANAQVILDRVKSGRFGGCLDEVLNAPNQFEKPYSGQVSDLIKSAVSAVFDKGERVTAENIYYYVNPNISSIDPAVWSKSKRYVLTIGHGKYIHEYWST